MTPLSVPTERPLCQHHDALDIVILVSKSRKLSPDICENHQNFVARIFSCLKCEHDNPRIAYIEFDQHVHIKHRLLDNHEFNLESFYKLHDLIRYSDCNIIPNDIITLTSAFQTAIDEFSIGQSDILHRKKKLLIFS